jgi:hypothetical protein
MAVTPTPEQIAIAELNGWDPQEVADRTAQGARMHELMRKHTKPQLLRMVLAAGTTGKHHPSTWTKQELAGEVARQEREQAQQS